ncbi:MAG: GIY-YIG nuclease family protein [Planctomycetota bacterium]|jgi:predicted GIY-YIG superfamily endonuclease|nr:GIY-YIG nuclease family protein [Planctomycetota bacterium]
MPWSLYILLSSDGESTYVGVSTDVNRRIRAHNGEIAGGAKRTRAGRPWSVAAVVGPFPDRAAAQAAEYEVKRLRGQERLSWAKNQS